LNTLQQAALKIGLGTAADNSNTNFTLDAIKIRDYFDAVVTSNLVPEGKPSPAVYLKVAELLQVQPAQCLVFEDTVSGVQAAVAAGMQVVGVTTGISAADMQQLPVVATISDYEQLTLSSFLHLF
jgi:HAD superfamily hydrolase (TIGR01509 family)